MTNLDIQRGTTDIERRADTIRGTADAVLKIVDDLPESETKFTLNAKIEGIVTDAAHIGDYARLVAAADEGQYTFPVERGSQCHRPLASQR